jgi:hypothetical protein
MSVAVVAASPRHDGLAGTEGGGNGRDGLCATGQDALSFNFASVPKSSMSVTCRKPSCPAG